MGSDTMTRLKTATTTPTAYRPASNRAARNCRHRLTIEVCSAASPGCQAAEETPRRRLVGDSLAGGRRFNDLRPDPAGRAGLGLGLDAGPQPALGPGQRLADRVLGQCGEPRDRSLG